MCMVYVWYGMFVIILSLNNLLIVKVLFFFYKEIFNWSNFILD